MTMGTTVLTVTLGEQTLKISFHNMFGVTQVAMLSRATVVNVSDLVC